jgi:hypothetical protein
MAQGARQSSLFAAEDFSVIYESFAQANFQAYDFNTIRNAMVDYMNNNYPENFNDWISSSEFVSLMELMAFLGHNLAFRNDLNARENFLSTAERRESALRIAEFLGYTPTRNVVASGYLKIDSIKTNETVYDIDGSSLANRFVQFDDVSDPDSFQRFLTVMNAVFQTNSKFGAPYAKFTDSNNVRNEIYRTNSLLTEPTFSFSGKVSGARATFDMHSVYYNQTLNKLEEKAPNPYGVLDLLYRNDNSGFTSKNTGFFIGFKQGSLKYKDFNIENGLPNLVLDINDDNIANGNIWVQTIDEAGQVLKSWTQIDRLFGHNAVFNAVNKNVRDIFTVSSRENDQISVVFGDGDFGNVPRGLIRVWYRTGLNQSYRLNPSDVGSTGFTFEYSGADGSTYRADVNCSLKSVVSNASSRESIDSIKTNAGRFFATQDRMITAEDYSIYPITVSNNIRKIKSINRVHSGHSRFRDFYDPTATYSDATQYFDDGYLYLQNVTSRQAISLSNNLSSESFFQKFIKPLLNNPEVKNFYYHRHHYGPNGVFDATKQYTDTQLLLNTLDANGENVYRWNQVSKSNDSCTGYINFNSVVQRIGEEATLPLRRAEVNGLIQFVTFPYREGYIKTVRILNGGSGYNDPPTVVITGKGTGAIGIANVANGKVVSVTIDPTQIGENYDEATNIEFIPASSGGSGAIAVAEVASAESQWARVVNYVSSGLGEDDPTGIPKGIDTRGRGAIVLNKVIPTDARIKRIVPSWEYALNRETKAKVIQKLTGRNSFGLRYKAEAQSWEVIENTDLPSNSVENNSVDYWSRFHESDTTGTGRDNSWIIRVNYTSSNWEILTRKTRYIYGSDTDLKFSNLNFAETFSSETLKPARDSVSALAINTRSSTNATPLGTNYKFNAFGYFVYPDGFTDPHKIRVTLADPDNDGFPNDPAAFHKITAGETTKLGTRTIDGYSYKVWDPNGTEIVDGRANLHTKYQRIADLGQVIDPSITNIIDTYVLLESYEQEFKIWAEKDGRSYTKPVPPTVNELNQLFSSLNVKKSISDQIIYRPVKFKILFGDLASSELQARFNVTKTANATMSDTEIKQQVVKLIKTYFNIDNWDFGETFYFTELAAYIHNNMVGQISQITISPIGDFESTSGLFEIRNDSDEMFMPILNIDNVVITNEFNANPTSIAANSGVSLV